MFRANERLIGYRGFFPQIVDGIEELEIGYRLHFDYWGQGIATEAARAVRDYAFADLALARDLDVGGSCVEMPIKQKNSWRLERAVRARQGLVLADNSRHFCLSGSSG